MDGESNGAHGPAHGHGPLGHAQGQLVGSWWSPATTDVMSQLCRVCGEPAAGFHFGAFTCEGCKSFFGRTYNNLGSITECKNQGACVINKKNRTSCKACRLRKCLLVGMSKSGSRYGRRSNWFKIHCLLQEQQHQHQQLQPPPPPQQHQHQHVPPPPHSPPEKSPKGEHGSSPHPHTHHRGPRGVSLGPEGLYGHAMLWGPAGPALGPAGARALLPLPPPPPHSHGAHLPLPFPPFLPAAAAAAAAALNGGVPSSLFGMPPPGAGAGPGAGPGPPRHEWSRLASPMSSGSTSPPASPRPRVHHKLVVAPRPPTGHRRLSSPRIDVDVDPDTEQEQPMDLSRTAAFTARRLAPASPPVGPAPFAQDLDQDADGENNNCDGDDKDGSDSGVSERESDRVVDGDVEGERQPAGRGSPGGPGHRSTPVDLSARLSC